MRAFYNAAGLRLLAEGIDSPESYDLDAADRPCPGRSMTTQNARDDERRDRDLVETDDPFASEVCAVCSRCAPPGEYIEYMTPRSPGLCWACLGLVEKTARLLIQAQRFLPRKCQVRVVETSGAELKEAI